MPLVYRILVAFNLHVPAIPGRAVAKISNRAGFASGPIDVSAVDRPDDPGTDHDIAAPLHCRVESRQWGGIMLLPLAAALLPTDMPHLPARTQRQE